MASALGEKSVSVLRGRKTNNNAVFFLPQSNRIVVNERDGRGLGRSPKQFPEGVHRLPPVANSALLVGTVPSNPGLQWLFATIAAFHIRQS